MQNIVRAGCTHDPALRPRCGTVLLQESLRLGPCLTRTGLMTGTNTGLTAAVEAYFADLGRVRASGGATSERSSYGPLAHLLNAIGAALKPKVFCGELAGQGAGHPDFGLYAAKQVQRSRPREGQIPERGVVEVKAADDNAWLTAKGDQISRYWGRYRLVLVTNTCDFVRLAAPGLSLLAASNHAAMPSRPMRSSRILPKAGRMRALR